MKTFIAIAAAVLLFVSGVAGAQTVSLNMDWGFNIDGETYCFDGLDCTYDIIGYTGGLTGIGDLPSFIDVTGIDLIDITNLNPTGLGTVKIMVEGAGTHSVIAYFDIDLGADAYDENGMALNDPVVGQTWEIDEPGDGNSGNGTGGIPYFGDLLQFNLVIDGMLDNLVYHDAVDGQDLPGNGDAAMAIGEEFDLADGEMAIVSFTVTDVMPTSTPPVFHLKQFDADESNTIYFMSSVEITIPDLRVSSVSKPPRVERRGRRFSIKHTTINVGNGESDATRTCFYLSTNRTKGRSDKRLRCTSIPELLPGEYIRKTTRVRIPKNTRPRRYYVLACSDAYNSEVESNESNNCKVAGRRIRVTK
ncbi:MAG: hypothetical protein JSU90_12785 [Nitrospiraceae bacterium]|nr:MAG: hypothetical protein JSU90_12785 [Nitrospiraceae bacterium]